MPRLPQVGGDAGNWGEILNTYLSESHKADGTLKESALTAAWGGVLDKKLIGVITDRSEQLGEPINLITEGCVGDGVTDDTAAFTTAWEKFISQSTAGHLVIPSRARIYLPNGFRYTFTQNKVGGIIEGRGGASIITDPGVPYALDLSASSSPSRGWRQFTIRDIIFINAGVALRSTDASGGTLPQFDLDRITVSSATAGDGIHLAGVFECRIHSPNITMGASVTDYDAIRSYNSGAAVASSIDIFAPNTRYGRRGITANNDTKVIGGTILYSQFEGIVVSDALAARISGLHVENCWQSVPSEVGQNSVPFGRAGVRLIGNGTIEDVYATQGTNSYRMSSVIEAYASSRITVIGGASTRLRSYGYLRGATQGMITLIGVPPCYVEPSWATTGLGRVITIHGNSSAPFGFSGAIAGTAIPNTSGGGIQDLEARAALSAILVRMRELGLIPS